MNDLELLAHLEHAARRASQLQQLLEARVRNPASLTAAELHHIAGEAANLEAICQRIIDEMRRLRATRAARARAN